MFKVGGSVFYDNQDDNNSFWEMGKKLLTSLFFPNPGAVICPAFAQTDLKQVRLVSAEAERPNHPSRGGG